MGVAPSCASWRMAATAGQLASVDLFRAALLRWMSPLRAARSSRLTAIFLSASEAVGDLAFFTAVRRVARCARLRTAAARDFRIFFFADAILGTNVTLDQG